MEVHFLCSFECKASMLCLLLKYPLFVDTSFQLFHFSFFSLFASSNCAFLNANFNAFTLFFFDFFTFSGSFGCTFNLSGIFNSLKFSNFISSCFYVLF